MRKAVLWMCIAAGALALVFAGCGGDDDDNGNGGGEAGQSATAPAETTKLTVSIIPIIDYAPLYIAMEEGFFQEEGLEVEPQIAQTGAAITAALVSGEAQVGGLAAIAALQAKSRNIPITAIAPDNVAPEEGQTAVVAAKDSGIENPEDLNGKTVAVNALQAFSELVTRAALDKLGGDASTLEFTTVDFPEMVAALDQGRVDAAQVAEPFLLAAQNQGHKVLFYPAAELSDDFAISVWIASEKYAQENPEVIERFRRAIVKANELAEAEPERVREILPTYTRIPPEVAAEVSLPRWATELTPESLQMQADLMEQYGFVEEAPSAQELVFQP